MKALANDLSGTVFCDIGSDSTNSIGTALRQGVGRIWHVKTRRLRVKQPVELHKLSLVKASTKSIAADLGTKYLDSNFILNFMQVMGLIFKSGESKLALKATP